MEVLSLGSQDCDSFHRLRQGRRGSEQRRAAVALYSSPMLPALHSHLLAGPRVPVEKRACGAAEQSPRGRHWESSRGRGVLRPGNLKDARHFCRFRMGLEGYSYKLIANHKSTLPSEPRYRHLP